VLFPAQAPRRHCCCTTACCTHRCTLRPASGRRCACTPQWAQSTGTWQQTPHSRVRLGPMCSTALKAVFGTAAAVAFQLVELFLTSMHAVAEC
jgi:hypothetical protein